MEAADAQSVEQQISGIKSTLAQMEGQAEVTEEMRQLRCDMQELLQLLEEQLLEMKKAELLSAVESIETETAEEAASKVGLDLNERLISQRCSVPHWSAHGVLHRQNAVICGVDAARAMVRVLISAPTRLCDLPCERFLEGESEEEEGEGGCGRHGASCCRSHGLVVKVTDLEEFQEPDLSRLREGSSCLVKLPGKRLWHHAKVAQIDTEGGQCVVEFRHAVDIEGSKSYAVPWEDVMPLDDSSEEEESEEEEEETEISHPGPRTLDAESARPPWDSGGIAWRLMMAMGFEEGRGLGARGQGRLEPVPIEVLPPGASLDRVMRLRERRRAREEERTKEGTAGGAPGSSKKVRSDVFSFLNRALSSSSSSSSSSSRRFPASAPKSLGAQLLAAEKEVAAAERRLHRLSSALSRGVGSGRLRAEVAAAEAKRKAALAAVASLERQKERQTERRKLTVF